MPATFSPKPAALVISQPGQLHWLYALLLGGALLWLEAYYMATLLLVFTLLLAVSKTLLEVDTVRQRYRIGLHLLGLPLGGWHPLPPAHRVVVRFFSELAVSTTDGGGTETQRQIKYLVLLSVPDSAEGVILWRCLAYKQALHVACFLGSVLQLEVVSFDQYKQSRIVQEVEEPE